MPQVGLEPTIPVFERAKTVHALDRAATVIGLVNLIPSLIGGRDSWINITTGYGLDDRGSIPGRSKRIFCTPQFSDQL
jgi:hypothetical protein